MTMPEIRVDKPFAYAQIDLINKRKQEIKEAKRRKKYLYHKLKEDGSLPPKTPSEQSVTRDGLLPLKKVKKESLLVKKFLPT